MQKALNARNRCLRIGCVLTGSGLVHNQNKERGQARLPDLRGSPARLFSFDLRGIQNWVVTLRQENLSGREGGLAPALWSLPLVIVSGKNSIGVRHAHRIS